jgi:hypothetical protein
MADLYGHIASSGVRHIHVCLTETEAWELLATPATG